MFDPEIDVSAVWARGYELENTIFENSQWMFSLSHPSAIDVSSFIRGSWPSKAQVREQILGQGDKAKLLSVNKRARRYQVSLTMLL